MKIRVNTMPPRGFTRDHALMQLIHGMVFDNVSLCPSADAYGLTDDDSDWVSKRLGLKDRKARHFISMRYAQQVFKMTIVATEDCIVRMSIHEY